MKKYNLHQYNPHQWFRYVFLEDSKLLEFCRVSVSRSSGKGGQKKDKTSNFIRLSFFHFYVSCQKHRLQKANKKAALVKLRKKIALEKQDILRTNWKEVPEELQKFIQTKRILIQDGNKNYPFFIGFWNDLVMQFQAKEEKIANFLQVSKSQVIKWDKKNCNLLRRNLL